LARAASEILSKPDRGAGMGKRGADYAREHLDIHKTIDEFTAGYFSVVPGARVSSSVPGGSLS